MRGIGIERVDKAPELFGTFSFTGEYTPPASKTALTTSFQSGRNTLRGRVFQPLGSGPAYKDTSVYSFN